MYSNWYIQSTDDLPKKGWKKTGIQNDITKWQPFLGYPLQEKFPFLKKSSRITVRWLQCLCCLCRSCDKEEIIDKKLRGRRCQTLVKYWGRHKSRRIHWPSKMEQFDQLLTCCVCLDRYRTPKLLPCQVCKSFFTNTSKIMKITFVKRIKFWSFPRFLKDFRPIMATFTENLLKPYGKT